MTRADLMKKYDNDAKLVSTIIQLKLKDPQLWKPNPDAPDVEAATLYKCWDYETEQELAESETSGQLSLSTSIGQNEARAMVPSIAELGLAKNMPCTKFDPSSSSLPARNTDDEQLAKEEQKRLQEAEKEKKKREKEEAAEKKKNLPSTKARRWAVGVSKEVGNVLAQIEDMGKTNIGAELKALYSERFGEQKAKLVKMKADLETCGDDAAARALVVEAPAGIEVSKKLRLKWCKIVKTASD